MPEEWCRYYAMLSASITNDDEFELMMRQVSVERRRVDTPSF